MKEIKNDSQKPKPSPGGGFGYSDITEGSFVKSENREACYYEYGNLYGFFFVTILLSRCVNSTGQLNAHDMLLKARWSRRCWMMGFECVAKGTVGSTSHINKLVILMYRHHRLCPDQREGGAGQLHAHKVTSSNVGTCRWSHPTPLEPPQYQEKKTWGVCISVHGVVFFFMEDKPQTTIKHEHSNEFELCTNLLLF